MKLSKLRSDLILISGLLGGSIVTIYWSTSIISNIYLIILLLLSFQSNKDYLWLVFVFILVDPPAGLFPNFDRNYGLQLVQSPFYVSFQEFYIYLFFLKAIIKSPKYRLEYRRPYLLLSLLFFVLILLTFFLERNIPSLLKTIKWVLPWTLVYSIPVLLNTQEKWYNFFSLVFALVFLIFSLQIYQLILGYSPANLLGTNFSPISGELSQIFVERETLNYDVRVARPFFSTFFLFIAFMGAMFYLTLKEKKFSENYLYLILVTCLVFMFLSATRGFVLSLSVMVILFFVFIKRDFSLPFRFSLVAIPFIIIILNTPLIQNQVIGSSQRMFTIQSLLLGDITAGGTLDRFSEYTPTLLSKFYESPLWGWAFTSTFWLYNNPHAGIANMLMNIGIIGNLIFLIFWIYLLAKPNNIYSYSTRNNQLRMGMRVMQITFVGLFILHATSGQQFGYLIGFTGIAFSQTIFYGFSDFQIKSCRSCEYKIRNYVG